MRREGFRRRRRVPWMRPTELRDCGAAAFASVAWSAGHEVSVEEARDLVRTDNNGTHLVGLIHGGRTIGLQSTAAVSNYDGLRRIDGWAIVHLDPGAGHFVVLLRWTRRGLWVMDPNRGRTFMRRAEFERESSRYVVVYRPTAALRPRRSRVEPGRAARELVARAVAWHVLAVSCAAAGAALLLASPLVLGHVFDRVLPQGDSTTLAVLALVLIGLGVVQAMILLARVAGEGGVQRRLSRHVGEKLLRHFATLPQSVYDTRCTAGFVLRTMTATDVAQGLGPNLVALCADAGMASFALVLIMSHSMMVGVAVAASLPLSWLIWHATRRRATNAQHHVWMTMERFTSRTVDTFVELRSVRLSGSTDRFVGGLVDDFDALAESQRAQRIALAVPAALSALLFASLAGLVLWWLGSNVIAGNATAGDLVLVVGTISLFLGPAQQFPSHLSNVTLALDAVRRVEEVLQRPNEVDRGTPDSGWTANGAIELRHASLRHSGRSHALDDVSLSIEPGEVVAFVGETGSGKTSVANLVCGFYDPDSGDVLIDGRSHADVTHADWRRQVAAVFQDSGLLQRSVRDNVAMLQDVPDDVVLRSLEVTDADEFVRRLRHGIQSQVSLGGDNFSAGQGQRLALARAVVRDAPILVLDEATCNLDSHTERKVMDSILERRRGKTTLLFGHRLSALDRASRVVVLAGGRVVETGTLDELVARNEEFVRLFEAQLAQRRRPRRLSAALPPPSASDDVA